MSSYALGFTLIAVLFWMVSLHSTVSDAMIAPLFIVGLLWSALAVLAQAIHNETRRSKQEKLEVAEQKVAEAKAQLDELSGKCKEPEERQKP